MNFVVRANLFPIVGPFVKIIKFQSLQKFKCTAAPKLHAMAKVLQQTLNVLPKLQQSNNILNLEQKCPASSLEPILQPLTFYIYIYQQCSRNNQKIQLPW